MKLRVKLWIFVAVGLLVLTTAGLMDARNTATSASCQEVLQNIDRAKLRWAVEDQKATNSTPAWKDMLPYLPQNQQPKCPRNGTYTIGPVRELPTCSCGARL